MISAFLLFFLSSVFLGQLPTSNDNRKNNLGVAIETWKKITTLKNKDRDLARVSQKIYEALELIDNLNKTLDGLRTWCSSDPEPYGMASIAAISKATQLAQELNLKSIQVAANSLTAYYIADEANSHTLQHYRQSMPNSCSIPGNVRWALSSTKPIVKFQMKNAGTCIYGGDSNKSWSFCNEEVHRNEI